VTPTLYAAIQRHNAGEAATAEAMFQAALAENPFDADAWQLLASHLILRDHFATAAHCADRATELAPDSPVAWSTYGLALHHLERYHEAQIAHNHALKLDSNFAPALRNRAMTHYSLGDLDAANADFDAARVLIESDRSLDADAAWPALARDDLSRGLELSESRNVKPSVIWEFGIPLWRGEDLTGKSILVHHEQGFGDTIMWSRYLPQVKASRVIVAVHFGLFRLFRAQGFDTVVLPGEVPEVDFQVPFDSLAYVLRVERASGEPYMVPPPHKALLPVARHTKLKVGIIWSSGTHLAYGRRRSMPVENVLPLTGLPGVQLFSLAPEGTKDLEQIGAGSLVTDMAPMIRDWADTAAIIDKLDLLVSVDTAALHLAGAMGKRAIGLMSFAPAWQWHPRLSLRARWYDSVELLWSCAPGEWSPLIDQVRRTLLGE
jgi:hypothetical protein